MFAIRYLAAAMVMSLGVFAAPSAAQAALRALVIGNAAYQNGGALANPKRDAEAFAAFLRTTGFTVTEVTDARRSDMGAAITMFADTLRPDDTAVFYYSGHGLQMEGENYLVGVEAQLRNAFDVPAEAIGLTAVIGLMEKRAHVSLIFIDACRNNPLIENLAKDATRAVTRGLAPIHPEGDGAMVAFAAGPGQVAFDGVGDNSPFTTALIAHLGEPGLEVGTAFKRVIRDVREATLNRQSPQLVSSLATEVYLGGAVAVVPAPTAASTPAPLPEPSTVKTVPTPAQQQATVTASPISSAPVLAPLGAEPEAPTTAALAPIMVPFEMGAPTPELPGPTPTVPAPEPVPAPKPVSVAELDFGKAKLAGTLRAWQLFLTKHPKSDQSGRGALELARLATAQSEAKGRTPAQIEAELTLAASTRVLIQKTLAEQGFDPGAPDGVFGSGTRAQIAAFQKSTGLNATGYLTVEAIVKLGIPIGLGRVADTSGPFGKYYSGTQLDGLEADPRVLKAVKALSGSRLIYGFFENRLYVAVGDSVPYAAAQARARMAGGYLVSINSTAENDFVYSLFRDDRNFLHQDTGPDHSVHINGPAIGYHRTPDGRNWVWDSGETTKFANWDRHQPDDFLGRENAAYFWYELPFGVKPGSAAAYKPTWNDEPDTGGPGFIIEIE